jgi:hypothetical protein
VAGGVRKGRARTQVASFRSEVDLYEPVKALLEAQGYEVKGEVRGCDVVAVREPGEPPVIVEMKLAFTLPLLLQGLDRLALTDAVYLAVPVAAGRRRRSLSAESPDIQRLCRRIGLGLIVVHLRGRAEALLDPLPYRPRPNRKRAALLLAEHARRRGDPNRGGAARVPIVTAYRQEALRCAGLLLRLGPLPVKALREGASAPRAASILQRNVYGWFERIARGTYRLTAAGEAALATFAHALAGDPPPPASEALRRLA